LHSCEINSIYLSLLKYNHVKATWSRHLSYGDAQ